MKTSNALLICLTLASLVLVLPGVNAAQATSIHQLAYPPQALAGGLIPIPITATVYYNNTIPGNTLVVGILDADLTPQRITPGLVTSSPDSCLDQGVAAARCQMTIKSPSGAEHLSFKIGGIFGGRVTQGTWDLNITAALFDRSSMLIVNSVSTTLFKIQLTPAAFKLIVPSGANVTIDGVQQPPGPAQVGVALGMHNITVPALVQVDPSTRLRFDHWSDGLTEPNRTIVVNRDMSLEAVYVTQNLLTITGPQAASIGAGWYDESETATFSVAAVEPMAGILGALGGKLRFQGWYENGELITSETTGTISMNRVHTIAAVWQADYTQPIVIVLAIAIILAFTYLIARKRTTKRTRRSSHRSRK